MVELLGEHGFILLPLLVLVFPSIRRAWINRESNRP